MESAHKTLYFLFTFAAMKLVTFFLSCWLLVLSCIPCGDSIGRSTEGHSIISVTTEHQHQQHKADHCTPFCTCSCCATPAFPQMLPDYSSQKQVFAKLKYPVYNMPCCREGSCVIWQPPKLS